MASLPLWRALLSVTAKENCQSNLALQQSLSVKECSVVRCLLRLSGGQRRKSEVLFVYDWQIFEENGRVGEC